MIQKKLQALNYPKYDKKFDDDDSFRELICWLEKNCIRNCKSKDLNGLVHTKSGKWDEIYTKYLKDIGCPMNKRNEQLEWLLSLAIRLEYSDNVDKYGKIIETKKETVPKIVSTNPLDDLDFNSNEFKNGVHSLAKLLNITPHNDHLLVLEAISKLVQKRLSANALENPNSIIVKGTSVSLSELNLGVKLSDIVATDAAKILRLLYIQNLRELQTRINETIVSVQQITANPKTDTKLGKVGF